MASYWNSMLFGGSKAGEVGLDGLRAAAGRPLDQPVLVEQVSWTATGSSIEFRPGGLSRAAVFVWPDHVGLVHVKSSSQVDFRLIPVTPGSVAASTPDRWSGAVRVEGPAGVEVFRCGPAVAQSVVQVVSGLRGWPAQVTAWPRPVAGQLLGGSPVHQDRRSSVAAALALLPAGLELRTKSHLYGVAWPEVAELRLDGANEYGRKYSLGAVALVGVLALAFPQKTASSIVSITERDGVHHALATEQLLATTRGALGQPFHWVSQPADPGSKSAASATANPAEQILAAGQMVRDGLLSVEEFEKLKAHLL